MQTIGRAARNVNGRVVLYADKITDAIAGAVEETDRRRAKQVAYNEEHGITPETIVKGVSDIAEFLSLESPTVPGRRRRGGRKVDELGRDELEKLVIELEEEMFLAAEELRFEYAAKLRDEIKDLRRELLTPARATTVRRRHMCRNIHTLHNYEPPATEEEVRDAALQYVRKISGSTKPSKANEAAFERAVDEVAAATSRLLDGLVTSAPPRNREAEAAKKRELAQKRFGAVGACAGEAALGDGHEGLAVEDVRLDGDRGLVGGDHMRSLRLAEPMGSGSREPRRGHHDDRALSGQHLELAPLGDAGLVDVAGEDELGAGCRQLLQHAAAAGERALARPPRRVGELVVQADDAQRTGRRSAEPLGGALHRIRPEASRLVPPRPDRVDADHV